MAHVCCTVGLSPAAIWGIAQAMRLLPFSFEKSDAKEKWGGENIFSALTGSPSLRCESY